MRQIILITVTTEILFLLSSCCTKKDCLGAGDIYEIEFYNFVQHDLDTIILMSYTRNSNFATYIDSMVMQGYYSSDSSYIYALTNTKIQTDRDYKIVLVSTGQVFKLTNFEIATKTCNACFPWHPASDYFNVLSSYSVNGQPQAGGTIRITR